MTNIDITISIVTYKSNKKQFTNIINSILNTKLNFITYIIDNSPDNEIEKYFIDSRIIYIFNNNNIGFGAGHNIAIKKAIQNKSKYHLVVNPDIYFDSDAIPKMLEFMNQNKDVGLLMPEILYPDGQIQYLPKLLPSPLQLVIRKTVSFIKFFKESNDLYELRNVPSKIIYETPIISGCFSLFRTDALKKVDGYDERYFMYFEDFDISKRVNIYYKTIYFPLVSVYHEYERGANKKIKLLIIFINSAIQYFNKWGWFFEKNRKTINKKTLNQFKL